MICYVTLCKTFAILHCLISSVSLSSTTLPIAFERRLDNEHHTLRCPDGTFHTGCRKQASVSGWGSAKFCHTHSLAVLFVSDFCQVQSIPIPRAQGMSYTLPADRPQETLLDSGFFRSFNMKFCPHKSLQVSLTSVKLHRHAEFFALWPLLVWGLLSYMPSNKLKCCWLCWAHLEIGIELDDGQIR